MAVMPNQPLERTAGLARENVYEDARNVIETHEDAGITSA
jgi:hypothetical protein